VEGHQIGSYRIERKLGEGGMGVVWIGVDVRLGRRAAIKQLLPEMSHNREIVERFFNEAKAAASINHPGIVEIYDVGWHADGSAYFAMKLLEGDSLAKRLRTRGPMPVMVAATIARQVASALSAAHQRGIVHRDLKPDNIVLVADDEVSLGERATVLDFGIAKLFGDGSLSQKTRTGSVMGTPSYMSPEQCKGAGEVDQRTDVYALGCILFEMLTGRPPHVSEGAGEVLGMHMFVEPPTVTSLRGDVPPAFEAVVMRALSKRAELRHQNMAELTAALQPFATARSAGEPVSIQAMARPAPSQPSPSQPPLPTGPVSGEASTLSAGRGQVVSVPPSMSTAPRSRTGLWLAVGGGAVAAAAVAIVVAMSGGDSPSQESVAATPGPPAPVVETAAPEVPVAVIDAAPAPTPTPTPTPAAADPRASQLVAEARAALAGEKWVDADRAAAEALALDTSNDEARTIRDKAAREQVNELRHDDFVSAVQNRNYAGAVAAFEKISPQSVYKNRAREHLDELHTQFLTEKKKQAAALAKAGKCAQLAKLADEAGKVFADARAIVTAVPCKELATTGPVERPRPEPTTGPLEKPTPPGGGEDAKAILLDAETAAKTAQWARAMMLAEKALAAATSSGDAATRARAAMVAGLAACNLKNEQKAKKYIALANPNTRTLLRQRCLANGVSID